MNDEMTVFLEEHKSEVAKMIKAVFFQNLPAMRYLNVDFEEFQGIANLIIIENADGFIERIGSGESDKEPLSLLRTIVDRKTKTKIRDNNREKRLANLQVTHFSETLENDENGVTVGDKIPAPYYDIDEAIESKPGIVSYLKRLSTTQKNILILRLLGMRDSVIMETLGVSRQEFNTQRESMKMSEKTNLICRAI